MAIYEVLHKRPTGQLAPREVLRWGITAAALEGETALFDVLAGVGKSRSIVTLAKSDIPISVFTNLDDNYGQFERWGRKEGVPVEKFSRSTEDCPTFNVDDGGDIPDDAKTAYDQGWSPSIIHQKLDLPCNSGGRCPYIEKVRDLDNEGPGILVGHYTQAYVEDYVNNRVVVLDEGVFNAYTIPISNPRGEAQKFIDSLDEFPFSNARRPEAEDERRQDAIYKLGDVGLNRDEHRDRIGEFHALAPLLTYTLIGGERLENDLVIADLPGNRSAVYNDTPAKDDSHETIWILDPPDFSTAEAIIALDATPCMSNWERLLGEDFKHYRLFDNDQRNQYLRDQGYEFIQLNSHAWPSQGGSLNLNKCEAYLREIAQQHGHPPDLITSKAVLGEREGIEGLTDRGLDHLWGDSLTYGNIRGRNDLKQSELLVVLGSPSPPDFYYKRLAALHGECAERVDGVRGLNLTYGGEIADDILETKRRGDVFQAAMRAGREEDAEATVYVATGLIPDWLDVKAVQRRAQSGAIDACPRPRSEGMRQVMEVMEGVEGIATTEIVEQVDIGREMVAEHRRELLKQGLIKKVGERRWATYTDIGLASVNIAGDVDLSLSRNIPLKEYGRGGYTIGNRRDPRRYRDPVAGYPDWVLSLMKRARQRWEAEQFKKRWRPG